MTILGESDCANGLNITHHGVISHIYIYDKGGGSMKGSGTLMSSTNYQVIEN